MAKPPTDVLPYACAEKRDPMRTHEFEVIVNDHRAMSYLDHLVDKLDYFADVPELGVVAGT